MVCAKQTASSDISAANFHKFFVDKTAGMPASKDGASDPVCHSPSSEISFNMFQPVQAEEVASLISLLFQASSAVQIR